MILMGYHTAVDRKGRFLEYNPDWDAQIVDMGRGYALALYGPEGEFEGYHP